jgi:hypothetical protein
MMFIPSPDWRAHVSVGNPLESKITNGIELHRELSAGVTVTRFEDVSLAAGIDARSGDDVRYKIGEVYSLSSILSVSAGIMTSPFIPSFGCRLTWRQFDFLYAYRYHPQLGGTHIWGIALSK